MLSDESGALSGITGMPCREFYAEDYEEVGRRVCLWWYQQFSQPNQEGICLHDLFEWDGVSTLWFTNMPVLHPEVGLFSRLMIAIRTISLYESGEITGIRIIGNEPGLAALFRANRVPCDLLIPPSQAASPSGLMSKIMHGCVQFHRWYTGAKILRFSHPHQHRPHQRDTLFYSASQNEWRIPGDGKHRYHMDILEELLAAGIVQEVRPLVSGIPNSQGNTSTWNSLTSHALGPMQGFYAPGFTSLRAMVRAWVWRHHLRSRLPCWLSHPPEGFGRWNRWDFRALLNEQLNLAKRAVVRLVVRYEALKTAFRKTRPQALLLKDEVYSEGRLLVAAARHSGVRSIATQHGSIYPTHWCYVMDRESAGLSRPPLPDILGVYGTAVARSLVEKGGMPEEILRVIGARRFRRLSQCQPSPEITAFAGTGGKVILIAGQMHQDMPVLYDWCFQAAHELPELRFVFKPHPRDTTRMESLAARCREQANTQYFHGPLEQVLPASMVTVSSHSTVLLESVWLGIPAVSVQMSGEIPGEWQTGAGILHIVQTYEDLLQSFRQSTSGTLIDEAGRTRAAWYLEEYLGRSLCEDPEVLRGLFG